MREVGREGVEEGGGEGGSGGGRWGGREVGREGVRERLCFAHALACPSIQQFITAGLNWLSV